MDFAKILQKLYDLVIDLLTGVSTLWDWLLTPKELGFFSSIFTGVTGDTISITPIEAFGIPVIMILLIFGLIKAFVPGA